ncbi:MAG: hypothetical protein BWY04_00850 [candidate division CPR1 bacterium ADurb.Bin160]|jgi:hypothetical protein|uniref:Uncharacterized protein n=1 Tax=candidate division CPR1 bacterium ADurb.Bin160 TaxID=1852826 RepID=A0A1V5ZMJ9_9BACT|nr:MAG: hypothetical protein BWY04_00850 [candidate division CPR1 bacterium ADurb.Bin160]
MAFKLLTEEEILQLSEEELHNYLNGLKIYQEEVKRKLAEKKEILNKLMNEDLTFDKSIMSDRNKILVEDLKNML